MTDTEQERLEDMHPEERDDYTGWASPECLDLIEAECRRAMGGEDVTPPMPRTVLGLVQEIRRLRARQREGDIVFDGEDFIWPCGCRWSIRIPGDGWEWCDDHPRGRYRLRNDHGE